MRLKPYAVTNKHPELQLVIDEDCDPALRVTFAGQDDHIDIAYFTEGLFKRYHLTPSQQEKLKDYFRMDEHGRVVITR